MSLDLSPSIWSGKIHFQENRLIDANAELHFEELGLFQHRVNCRILDEGANAHIQSRADREQPELQCEEVRLT